MNSIYAYGLKGRRPGRLTGPQDSGRFFNFSRSSYSVPKSC